MATPRSRCDSEGAPASAKALIPRSMFPNALRSRKNLFAFDFSKNPSWKPFPHNGIFQRIKSRKHLRVLYLMKDQKHTPARWGFGDKVEDVIDEHFDQYYEDDQPNADWDEGILANISVTTLFWHQKSIL